jgi:hypothetical protein
MSEQHNPTTCAACSHAQEAAMQQHRDMQAGAVSRITGTSLDAAKVEAVLAFAEECDVRDGHCTYARLAERFIQQQGWPLPQDDTRG